MKGKTIDELSEKYYGLKFDQLKCQTKARTIATLWAELNNRKDVLEELKKKVANLVNCCKE